MLGFKQPTFAELVGCSLPTLQSIESGRLALSERLALKISQETGVNVEWLLDDDEMDDPTTTTGVSYRKEHYEWTQANRGEAASIHDTFLIGEELFVLLGQLGRLLIGLARRQPELLRVVFWKMQQFRTAMTKEFAEDAGRVTSEDDTKAQDGREHLVHLGKAWASAWLTKEGSAEWQQEKREAKATVELQHRDVVLKGAEQALLNQLEDLMQGGKLGSPSQTAPNDTEGSM